MKIYNENRDTTCHVCDGFYGKELPLGDWFTNGFRFKKKKNKKQNKTKKQITNNYAFFYII